MAILSFAAAFTLASLTVTEAETPQQLYLAQAQPYVATQGAVMGPQGDYMTTADGCTYRRTQAPGHPVRWIIVLNPHHIGKASSPGKCKGMM